MVLLLLVLALVLLRSKALKFSHALLCVLLLALDIQLPFVAGLGSGSYFIYLWHIFIVMVLRDYAELRQFGAVANFAITYIVTASGSILALLAVREIAPPRMIRWLGA